MGFLITRRRLGKKDQVGTIRLIVNVYQEEKKVEVKVK